ncbi:MAG: hypothetical protein HRT89_16415 [Lentisphaeria bacterium]|nr:hypothetical protein [Lentisphaeria bacterium]
MLILPRLLSITLCLIIIPLSLKSEPEKPTTPSPNISKFYSEAVNLLGARLKERLNSGKKVSVYTKLKKKRQKVVLVSTKGAALMYEIKTNYGMTKGKLSLKDIKPVDLANTLSKSISSAKDGTGLLALYTVYYNSGYSKKSGAIYKRLKKYPEQFKEAKIRKKAIAAQLAKKKKKKAPKAAAKKSKGNSGSIWPATYAWMAKVKPYYVAVNGKESGKGSKSSPWDISSVLTGKQKLDPGSVVWVLEGNYKNPGRTKKDWHTIGRIKGTAEKPIVIRGELGARVTLDGGLKVGGIEHVWVWGLEITASENIGRSRDYRTAPNLDLPEGALQILGGRNCKYINLIIQESSANGVGFWKPAKDSEIYGSVIAKYGYRDAKRGHGHAIYTQNLKDGKKIISNNIIWGHPIHGCFSIHAYTEGSYINNYEVIENIVYHGGQPKRSPFLIGGGNGEGGTTDIYIERNLLYGIRGIEIGPYSKVPKNTDCHIKDNVVVGGNIAIQRYKLAEVTGNTVYGRISANQVDEFVDKDNKVNPPKPKKPSVYVLPNKYDPSRAHIAVYNWNKAKTVKVSLDGFMKTGNIELRDPLDYYGEPIFRAKVSNSEVTVPLGGKDFVVFVLLKK